jgi:hypothetical protein
MGQIDLTHEYKSDQPNLSHKTNSRMSINCIDGHHLIKLSKPDYK